ncbi:ThiJ/PfpI [Jimgerdemannia flammicorona]|uniref:ThiJ/PfpI n=1 Tax=Jimgerdemannia flammicorona TaxID=994334 RepID=A0A433DKM3_9FUNG|nr:ThiJ/PfpI [Jimgerdemannia flammicorona]
MSLFGNIPALLKPPSDLRFTVGAVLFYDHDVLDLNGPLHFFGGSGQFEIKTIAETKEPVANCGGTHTLVTHTFDEDTEFDFLFIPGAGPRGLLDLSQNERVVAYVKKVAPRMKFIFSVCTGALPLALAGVLDGHKATTNKMMFEFVAKRGTNVHWQPKARWVHDGNIITASGVSAGMDAALHILEHLNGKEYAQMRADVAEYEWHSDPSFDPFAEKAGLV